MARLRIKVITFSALEAPGELVDLERDEDGRGHERQVLGPPATHPQADHFRRLQEGVADDHDARLAQMKGRHPEETLKRAEQPRAGQGCAATRLKISDDPVEIGAQGRLVPCHHEQNDRQKRQDHHVHQSIEGDEPQHITVPQRTASKRKLDLAPVWDRWAARLSRWRPGKPGVAPQAAMPTKTGRILAHGFDSGNQGILRPEVPGIGTHQHVAPEAAADQLPADLPALLRRTAHLAGYTWRDPRRREAQRRKVSARSPTFRRITVLDMPGPRTTCHPASCYVDARLWFRTVE